MTVLVDEAIWPWRGLRWAHLVSDHSYDELHQLAHQIGMPYRAFQGDHYDVHVELRQAAIEAGAVPTPSRELLRALKGAGLRQRGPVDTWHWEWAGSLSSSFDARELAKWLEALGQTSSPDDPWWEHISEQFVELSQQTYPGHYQGETKLGIGERPGVRMLGVHSEIPSTDRSGGLSRLSKAVSLHHSSGERGTFIELVLVQPSPKQHGSTGSKNPS